VNAGAHGDEIARPPSHPNMLLFRASRPPRIPPGICSAAASSPINSGRPPQELFREILGRAIAFLKEFLERLKPWIVPVFLPAVGSSLTVSAAGAESIPAITRLLEKKFFNR